MRKRGSTIGLLKDEVMDKILTIGNTDFKTLTVSDIVFKIMTKDWGMDESGLRIGRPTLLFFLIADPQSEKGITLEYRWIQVYRQGKYGLYHPKVSDAEHIAYDIVESFDVVYM